MHPASNTVDTATRKVRMAVRYAQKRT